MTSNKHNALLGVSIKMIEAETWKQRVRIELDELNEKRFALSDFILSDKYDALDEQNKILIVIQQNLMIAYSEVLLARLQANKHNSTMIELVE